MNNIGTDVTAAAEMLRDGGVVAMPTETVYGLAAAALNEQAVRRVFAIKGRPADHPLIVHLASGQWLADWARVIPDAAYQLVEAFWPGPLTFVLPRTRQVSDVVTGGQDSVALRVPSHPLAHQLIAAAGALVAPSANRFGRISPTAAEHVREELDGAVDYILDGGPCAYGVESTIVGLLDGAPTLLRPGGIAVGEIEAVLKMPLAMRGSGVRAPGLLPAHYAPATPLELCAGKDLADRAAQLTDSGRRVGVLVMHPVALPRDARALLMPGEAAAYAHLLYARLRELDAAGYDALLVETPPDRQEWLAVRDRLARAARAFAAL